MHFVHVDGDFLPHQPAAMKARVFAALTVEFSPIGVNLKQPIHNRRRVPGETPHFPIGHAHGAVMAGGTALAEDRDISHV